MPFFEERLSYEIIDHQYTENYLFESGLEYVVLRDSQYAEAMVSSYLDAAGLLPIKKNTVKAQCGNVTLCFSV